MLQYLLLKTTFDIKQTLFAKLSEVVTRKQNSTVEADTAWKVEDCHRQKNILHQKISLKQEMEMDEDYCHEEDPECHGKKDGYRESPNSNLNPKHIWVRFPRTGKMSNMWHFFLIFEALL